MSRNSLAAVCFLRIHGTDVRGKVFSVMNIMLDYPQSSNNPVILQAKIPTIFGFTVKKGFHTRKIGFLRHVPLPMKPFGRAVL